MNITEAQYTDADNTSIRAVIDGLTLSVPTDPANRHYAAIQEWVSAGNSIAPYVEPDPGVPQSVERLQARLALIAAGLWDGVTAYFDDPLRTAEDIAFWEDARIWKRDNPIIVSAGTALGLTSEQIDALFVDAATR